MKNKEFWIFYPGTSALTMLSSINVVVELAKIYIADPTDQTAGYLVLDKASGIALLTAFHGSDNYHYYNMDTKEYLYSSVPLEDSVHLSRFNTEPIFKELQNNHYKLQKNDKILKEVSSL